MPNISEEKWIVMLEKKADGTYIAKYPMVKSKSGVTFDEHLADYMPHDSELNQYASNIDSNGIYKTLEFKRTDGTLYMKSTLSNPDADGNYQTVTWQFYDSAGTTVKLTKTWTLTYDEDGLVKQKVVN